MAGAMAIKRSSYVAAAAPNSGGIISLLSPTLEDPSHVPAVMNMHGGAGDNVGINFGETSAAFADFITGAGSGSTCNVTCTDECSVSCSDGSTCNLTCAGDSAAAIPMGGSCPM